MVNFSRRKNSQHLMFIKKGLKDLNPTKLSFPEGSKIYVNDSLCPYYRAYFLLHFFLICVHLVFFLVFMLCIQHYSEKVPFFCALSIKLVICFIATFICLVLLLLCIVVFLWYADNYACYYQSIMINKNQFVHCDQNIVTSVNY